jgi:tetratricopeptide (TPR) repeat protein
MRPARLCRAKHNADMVRASSLAGSGDFLLRPAGCQGEDLLTEGRRGAFASGWFEPLPRSIRPRRYQFWKILFTLSRLPPAIFPSSRCETHFTALRSNCTHAYLSDTRAADLARADQLIGRALAASPRYALARYVKGQVLRARNRWEEAIPEYKTALASNPNFFFALTGLALCKLSAGSIEEVAPLVEQAIRLSPRDPHIAARTGTESLWTEIGFPAPRKLTPISACLWVDSGA